MIYYFDANKIMATRWSILRILIAEYIDSVQKYIYIYIYTCIYIYIYILYNVLRTGGPDYNTIYPIKIHEFCLTFDSAVGFGHSFEYTHTHYLNTLIRHH